jgi:hypothetical protein
MANPRREDWMESECAKLPHLTTKCQHAPAGTRGDSGDGHPASQQQRRHEQPDDRKCVER